MDTSMCIDVKWGHIENEWKTTLSLRLFLCEA